jgi:hypothetical protein
MMRFLQLPLILIASSGLMLGFAMSNAPPAQAFDYVVNGDFSSGADGWAVQGTTVLDVVEGGEIGAAGGVARVTLAGASFSLRQSSFAGTPAGQYQFSVRLRTSSPTAALYAQVTSNPSAFTQRFDAPQGANSWFEIGGAVDVTGFTNVTFVIGATGSTGDIVFVDDVRFDGAPPATMTPTNTPVPPTGTHTPLPPTGTRTPKPTNTPKATSTPKPAATEAVEATAGESDDRRGTVGGLRNAGFETVAEGAPDGWEKYGGSLTIATAPVHSGAYSARLESTTISTKWVFQTVAVSPNQTYAFDGWLLHNDAGIGSAFLRVSWYASFDGSGTAIGTADSLLRLDGPSDEWRFLTTGSIAAPPDARSAKLRVMLQPVSATRAALYVDDASFGSAAPAPPTAESDEEPGDIAVAGARSGGSRVSQPRATAEREPEGVPPPALDARITINEILYDPESSPDSGGEWVELYNAGALPISLEGWMLADNRSVDVIDTLTVPAGGLAIFAPAGFAQLYPDYNGAIEYVRGSIGNSLGNDGDVLVLLDPSGRFVDSVSWGTNVAALDPSVEDVPEGHSIERRTLGRDTQAAEDFVDNEQPSPGLPYTAPSTSPDVTGGKPGSVQVLTGEAGPSFGWVPWALATVSMAALAGLASWRVLPSLAARLRHQ